MYVAGFDLSLTRSAAAHAGERCGSATHGQAGVTLLPLSTRYLTISAIAAQVVALGASPSMRLSAASWCTGELPALAVIEAPDVSRGYGGLPERLYLHGRVVETLAALGVPVATVPSPILKGYATGNGGHAGGKARIKAAATLHWPGYFENSRKVTHDEVDAIVLAQMGWDWLTGRSQVPAAQRAEWLNRHGVEWPPELQAYVDEPEKA